MLKYLVYVLFKIFEIVLFLFPAFPNEFTTRVIVLIVYVIGHILGVQTQYKQFKQTTLDLFWNSEPESVLTE